MLEQETTSNVKYLRVIGGKIRQKVEEGTKGAEAREYVNPTTNEKGIAHELVYKSISGLATEIVIKDTDYGKKLCITFDGEHQLQVDVKKGTFNDLVVKLASVQLDQPFSISPYNFEDDKGKRRSGFTIKQNDEKLQSYFYDGKKNTNGMPNKEDDQEWTEYFDYTQKKFLTKYVTEKITMKQEAPKEDKLKGIFPEDDANAEAQMAASEDMEEVQIGEVDF